MHYSPDISAGSLATIFFTLAGAFITLGGLGQILRRLASDVAELRANHEAHIASDVKEFADLRSDLNDVKVVLASSAKTIRA
jgi:hypothetical protein